MHVKPIPYTVVCRWIFSILMMLSSQAVQGQYAIAQGDEYSFLYNLNAQFNNIYRQTGDVSPLKYEANFDASTYAPNDSIHYFYSSNSMQLDTFWQTWQYDSCILYFQFPLWIYYKKGRHYNQQNSIELEELDGANTVADTLRRLRNTQYIYPAHNKCIAIGEGEISNSWNLLDGVQYTVDSNWRITETIQSIADTSVTPATLQNEKKEEFVYQNDTLIEKRKYDWTDTGWSLNTSYYYTYLNNKLVGYDYVYKPSGSSVRHRKFAVSYAPSGKQFDLYTFLNDTDTFKIFHYYLNNNNFIDSFYVETFQPGTGWLKDYMQRITYNSLWQPIFISWENWDEQMGQWQLKYGTRYGYGFDSTSSIQQVAEARRQLTVYPNPAQSALYIKDILQGANWQITNATGSVVMNGKKAGNAINIRELPKGMYILFLTDDKGVKYAAKFAKE